MVIDTSSIEDIFSVALNSVTTQSNNTSGGISSDISIKGRFGFMSSCAIDANTIDYNNTLFHLDRRYKYMSNLNIFNNIFFCFLRLF